MRPIWGRPHTSPIQSECSARVNEKPQPLSHSAGAKSCEVERTRRLLHAPRERIQQGAFAVYLEGDAKGSHKIVLRHRVLRHRDLVAGADDQLRFESKWLSRRSLTFIRENRTGTRRPWLLPAIATVLKWSLRWRRSCAMKSPGWGSLNGDGTRDRRTRKPYRSCTKKSRRR